ncbi:MAG: phosphotransferase [Candidatus Edwardsbacteria bacterium]
MMNTNPNILLIDDISSTEGDVKAGLENIGITPSIKFVDPKDRRIPIEQRLPSSEELNEFDLALVDLQLYSPIGEKYDWKNLTGGTNVLPYLRKNAPWLPVIAASKLFAKEDPVIQCLAGSFGFDGQIEREMLPAFKMTRPIWNKVIDQAILLRKRAVLGADFEPEKSKYLDFNKIIINDNGLKNELDFCFPQWKQIVTECFYYADQIILTLISGGFSDSTTLKVEVIEKGIGKTTYGNWLVKISNNLWRLNLEVQSHQKMIRSGLEYARTVPLLWNGVLSESRVGLIAYQFATNTQTAHQYILNPINDILRLCEEFMPMLKGLYPKEKIDDKQGLEFSEVFSVWFSYEKLKKAASQLQNNNFKSTLLDIADKKTPKNIPSVIKPSYCWLHGDLHLRNILLGERHVLIDFARSKPGPLVLDLAKLISDLLLRSDKLRGDNFSFSIQNNTHFLFNKVLSCINNLFLLNDHDRILYELLIKVYLAIALEYPDVDDNTKYWIRNNLV